MIISYAHTSRRENIYTRICDTISVNTTIGQCMPHMELKLVDGQGRAVPIWAKGEIWARGYSIMSGYDRNPEETAKTITNSGWLQTGD